MKFAPLLLLASVCFGQTVNWSAGAYVTSGTTVSITVSTPDLPVTGDLIVVGAWNYNGGTVTCADSQSHSPSPDIQANSYLATSSTHWVMTTSPGSYTVTCTSSVSSYISMVVLDIQGGYTVLDGTAKGEANTSVSTVTSGSLTTTGSSDIVVAFTQGDAGGVSTYSIPGFTNWFAIASSGAETGAGLAMTGVTSGSNTYTSTKTGTASAMAIVVSAFTVAPAANLQVTAVTAQQATISYTAPSAAACTLALADNSGLGVTVWDVSAKFANSNVDLDRANTITWNGGLQRQIILGKRDVEVGTDGLLYSRSLQQNTSHTLTVTCGSAASVTFQTSNPAVGNMSPDPPAYNSAGFGNAGWPNMNWGTTPTQQNSTPYIDPKTGILLKPASWFGQLIFQNLAQTFDAYFDIDGTWTNASNITSGSSGSLASSSNTNPIFVAIPPNALGTTSGDGSNWVGHELTDIRLNVIGYGSTSGLVVNFCLTADSGQTCISATQSVTLPTSSATTSFPSGAWPAPPLTAWGMTTWPQHNIVIPTNISVTTSGTAVTNQASVPVASGLFATNLAAGSKVIVTGSSCTNSLCTVSSVKNASSMALVENIGTLTTTLTPANFGLKIWKANAMGTINITTTFDVAFEGTPSFSIADGGSQQCSSNPMTLTQNAAGTTVASYSANLCLLTWSDGTVAYAFIPSTGEMRPLGLLFARYGNGLGNCNNCTPPPNPFYSDGRTVLGPGYQQDTGNPEIVQWVYRGQGKQYVTGGLPFGGVYNSPPNGQSDGVTSCNSGEQQSGNLCVSPVTGTTSGNDLRTQAAACDANYAKGAFGGNPQSVSLVGNIFINQWYNQQDGIALFTYVDITSGNMTGCRDTMWSTGSGRWGGLHTAAGWIAGNQYHLGVLNPLGSRGNTGAFAGPYRSTVSSVCQSVDGSGNCTSWNSSNTAVSTSFGLTCPSSVCGSTLTNMLLVQISGYPCSAYANSAEYTNYPCPWNASYGMPSAIQAGDFLGYIDSTTSNGAASEQLKVVVLTVSSSTDIYLWLQRGYGTDGTNVCPQNQSPGACRTNFQNGWTVSPYPTGSADSAYWWMSATSPTGTVQYDYSVGAAHLDVGPGLTSSNYSYIGDGKEAKYNVAAGSGFSLPVTDVNSFGAWAGNTSFPNIGEVETYPSKRVYTGASTEQVWAADWHAYQGGAATSGGAGTQGQSATFTPITAGGRTHVWQIATGFTVNPKINPIERWAGRFIYQDISGPSSSITDATNRSYCIAYPAGECVPGSAAGNQYFSDSAAIITSNCWTNHMEASLPCLVNASPVGNWAIQQDISQNNLQPSLLRRLTEAMAAPSRQYTYTNWRPMPDASWGLFLTQYADGIFPVMWAAKLPPWPGYDSIRRDSFTQVPIQVTGTANTEIRFGYEEFGSPSSFYCTSRAEICATTASPTATSPFQYITTDGHSGISCASGCTITVPALPGRILWWQQFNSSDGGTTWVSVGVPQSVAN
jgi:hypothetical protein